LTIAQGIPKGWTSLDKFRINGPSHLESWIKVFNDLRTMGDDQIMALLDRLTDGDDEILRGFASKLGPRLIASNQPSTQFQNPIPDIRIRLSDDLKTTSPWKNDQPNSSTEVMLSELPEGLRVQLLDFLNHRDAERFSDMGSEIQVSPIENSSNPPILEENESMKVPKLYQQLGLTQWGLKERRDTYRLAIATALRDLTKVRFDLEISWSSHSVGDQERAVGLFVKTLERILRYEEALGNFTLHSDVL
jgi:hypothetical protein